MKKIITTIAIILLPFFSAYSMARKSIQTPTTNIIVFGDSLSDIGYYNGLPKNYNNWPTIPDTHSKKQPTYTTPTAGSSTWPQYLGKLTNTNMSTNNINTPKLNRKMLSTINTKGNVFAAGGATTVGSGIPFVSPESTTYTSPPPIGPSQNLQLQKTDNIQKYNQIDNYLSQNKGKANPNDVYIIWGGANDLFLIMDQASSGKIDPIKAAQEAAKRIAYDAQYLYNKGARKIVVINLPNLGITPLVTNNGADDSSDVAKFAATLSTTFNQQLKTSLNSLNNKNIILLDAETDFFDTIHTKKQITVNNKTFNFNNVTTSSCPISENAPNSLICIPNNLQDKTNYLFADSVHPTTYTHNALANYIFDNIKLLM